LFPQISSEDKTYCQEISKKEAIQKIIPMAITCSWKKQRTKEHFEILNDIVNKCSCYQFFFRENIEEIPMVLKNILTSV
ncbi:MAG: hypothetical protein HY934_09490, partial [Candidatus Firestonebacteria bacterium]|nr:hypothetical protein [Candidatus Firestonebacteria bacterium]